MDMKLLLIPVAMFVIAIIVVVVMNLRVKNLKNSDKQQKIKRYVEEQLPQLANTAYKVLDCLWNAEHNMMIVYNDTGIFFIPTICNPLTLKLLRYEDAGGAGLKSQVNHMILAGNAIESVDFIPICAITDIEVDEKKKRAKISVKDKRNTYKFRTSGFFGIDQTQEINGFFKFLLQIKR